MVVSDPLARAVEGRTCPVKTVSLRPGTIREGEVAGMDQDKKRELRQMKREIKRLGGKRRRRQLKQAIVENPEGAHEATFDYGRYESAALNGIDRKPDRPAQGPEEV